MGINMAKSITQEEANKLLQMKKFKVDDQEWSLPICGNKISVPLQSQNNKEKFLLDANSSRLCLSKLTLQNRTRETIILCRLDLGVPHRNPDGKEIPAPHLHIYREGYDDKWACPLPQDIFTNINDKWQIFLDFMKYCNIVDAPNFKRGLFWWIIWKI